MSQLRAGLAPFVRAAISTVLSSAEGIFSLPADQIVTRLLAQRGYFTIDKIMIVGVPVTAFANSGPVDLEEEGFC